MIADPVKAAEDLDYLARVVGHPNSRAGADWETIADDLRNTGALIRALMSPWRDTEEAAAHVRLSARTLEGYRRAGGGPVYHRQGGKVLYHRADLDQWIGRHRFAHSSEERISANSK